MIRTSATFRSVRMFITIKRRLELLADMQRKILSQDMTFDPEKANFGFKRMEQLFPVVQDEIKGYPCVAYDKFSDPIKFGIKVIPLELKYENSTHPCRIEIALLKEFTELVTSYVTPHITFFFKEMSVSNKKKALTRFPLKSLRKEIFKNSNVLVAEYVPGGSIEEWIQEQPNITEKQWKFIIFSVAWTLLVLQDSYKFLHNDFHYGNILVDTSIDPTDKSIYQYELNKNDESEPTVFNVQNVGLLPKLWDFEFASTYTDDPRTRFKNDFFKETEESIPNDFNPYYDLHCFLTSLLELDIPDRLRDFILSWYPEEVLPPMWESDTESGTSSTRSRSYSRSRSRSRKRSRSRSESPCNSNCSCCTYSYRTEEYYKTDESTKETDNSTCTSTSASTSSRDENRGRTKTSSRRRSSISTSTSDSRTNSTDAYDADHSRGYSRRRRSRSTASDCRSYSSEESELRTEFMLGDRMLNGTEKLFKLPTPMDLLESDYFADYRKPLHKKTKGCKFAYTMKAQKPIEVEIDNDKNGDSKTV